VGIDNPGDGRAGEDIGQLRISDAQGRSVPMAQLAQIRFEDGPASTRARSVRKGRRQPPSRDRATP